MNCLECGVSKDDLKREIIQEILPLLCSCKDVGGNGTSCQRAPGEGTSHPLYLYLDKLVPLNGASPNYATSAGMLDREIKALQQQVDQNSLQISLASKAYQREVGYLIEMSDYLEHTTDMLYKEVGDAKKVYEKEVDYLLASTDDLHYSTVQLQSEMVATRQTNTVLQREMSETINATALLQSELSEVQTGVEKVEMYGRRNNFEIDGIEELSGESTNKIALKLMHDLGLKNVTFKDICRSHRTSRRRKFKNLPRPIYVKLVNHDLKDAVMSRKDLLRELPQYRRVFIDENLTKSRRQLYSQVRREVGKNRCYTYDGTIYVKFFNNRTNPNQFVTKSINSKKDFNNIFGKLPSGK